MSSGLVLNTNINSLVAQNALTSSGTQLAQALEQLSTGLRINTAADDAAGYAIVNGMTSQINGLNQAAQNANDGVSLSQTASGALSEIVNDLQSMRDLAVESLNATNSSADRDDLDAQFQQLKADIDSVASTTQFNGVNLLDGSFQGASFQIGANVGQTITVASVASAASDNLGQLYTADATDPASYTSDGTTSGTPVASGDSGTFTLTIGGKGYTTSAVSLTGTQSTDLTTIAAAINQAVGSYGVVATVDSNSEGINLSSTTPQSVTASYDAATGDETLATFGLSASNNLTTAASTTTTYTATGAAVASDYDTTVAEGDSGTFSVKIGNNTYTTADAVTMSGDSATDLKTIAKALNAASDGLNTLSQAGITASVSDGKIVLSTSSGSLSGATVTYTAANSTAETESASTFGLGSLTSQSTYTYTATGGTASSLGAGDSGTFTVTLNGQTYGSSPVTFDGGSANLKADLTSVMTALAAATTSGTDPTTLEDAGVTIQLNSTNNGLVFTSSNGVQLSGTDGLVVNYSAGTGSETISSFGLDSFENTTAVQSSKASGTNVAEASYAGEQDHSGTFSVKVGSDTYTTAAVTLTGNESTDLTAIVNALNNAEDSSDNKLSLTTGADVVASLTNGTIEFESSTTDLTSGFTVSYVPNNLPEDETAGTFGLSGTLTAAQSTSSTPAAIENTLAGANVQTVDSSNQVVIQIDAALQQLATTGADLGAYQNRFQAAVTGLQTDSTNLSSARSQIQDTDYAQATSELTQAQILQQAGTAMVAQANEIPQNVLTLLAKLT